MTIEITGTFADGANPRLLHEGNRFKTKVVSAVHEVTNYPAAAVDNGGTVDRWRPFANELENADDMNGSVWTATRFIVGSDGQTLNEGTDASTTRFITQNYTWPNTSEHVAAIKIERQDMTGLRLQCNDGGGNAFTAEFNFVTLTGTVEAGTIHEITMTDLGNNIYECKMVFSPVSSGAGFVRIIGYDADADSATYTGTGRSVKVLRTVVHPSFSIILLEGFSAQAGDCMAVAAHNFGSSEGDLIFQHDSNDDGTFTTIDTVKPTDNSPVMIFFDAITSADWRITVRSTVLPEIGVFRVGAALKFERAFYAGFTVPRMNRNTEVIGNLSGNGQLLGRSRKRTTLNATYEWPRLSYNWVRANLDGPTGLIQSLEKDPAFVAWRPDANEDVDYLMRGSVTAPQAIGQIDLHSFSMSGEALAYE